MEIQLTKYIQNIAIIRLIGLPSSNITLNTVTKTESHKHMYMTDSICLLFKSIAITGVDFLLVQVALNNH